MKKHKPKTPQVGAHRIRHADGVYYLESFDYYKYIPFIGTIKANNPVWAALAVTQTLWGLKREWRKRFGTSKPFPSFTVWQSEEVL